MTIYSNLGLNFDTGKFGESESLSAKQSAMLLSSAQNIGLQDWQLTDLASGNVSNNQLYYVNPVASIIANLNSTITSIESITNTANFIVSSGAAANLKIACANTINSLSYFKTHTDLISGVTNSNPNDNYVLDLNKGLSVGGLVQVITCKSDNVQNNTPILGNFTSIFIGDDLQSNANTIIINLNTLSSSVFPNNNTFISNATVNGITSNINVLKTLVDTRRLGDYTFYYNSKSLVANYNKSKTYVNYTSRNNPDMLSIIQTDKLKQDLANSNTSVSIVANTELDSKNTEYLKTINDLYAKWR